ncbi:hypothetical protein AVEN_75597-1 [Araneus ventricosus]|uniref:Uncharacterized protein n=1 Tax=Araneus ventricosus TaxID=182803 RepID=A0A4Y2CL32_ARAVE|nr:hypothetical protein AVEN_75597-1 [Araneus ventricosus]
MSSHRMSKWALASCGVIIMVGVVLPPSSASTYRLREMSGRGPVMGYLNSGLSTRATAEAVIQYPGCFGVLNMGVTLFAFIECDRDKYINSND